MLQRVKRNRGEVVRRWGGNARGGKFKYLGVMISTDGDMGEEVAHRVLEGRKICWTMAML